MNLSKKNVALLITAIALAVPTWLQLRSEADIFKDLGSVPLLFDGFTSDNVGQILLAQPKAEQPPADPQNPEQKRAIAYDQLLLQRIDKGWAFAPIAGQPPIDLAGAPANKDRVESDVFARLRAIRIDREMLVQADASPEQLVEYGLDEAHAFVIKAIDSGRQNVVAELLVGNSVAGDLKGKEAVNGVFVRKADSSDVVLYEFDGYWRRDAKSEMWLDKVLLKPDPANFTRFSIRNTATAGVTFVFERKPGQASWQAIDPPAGLGALRQSEIEGLLQRLRYVVAVDFRTPLQRAGNLAALGLLPPQIEIEFSLREDDADRTVTIEVGNKVDDKNEYYMTCSESQFLLTWSAGYVTQFELDVAARWFDPPGEQGAPAVTPGVRKGG